jgi:hypothetical protein
LQQLLLRDTSATDDVAHMVTHVPRQHLHVSVFCTDHCHLCACTPQVELGEQLSQAGTLGSSSSLAAALTSLLGGKAAVAAMASQGGSSGAAPLPQPTEAVLLAFIVAVALAELSRAALAPLPDLGAPRQLYPTHVLV